MPTTKTARATTAASPDHDARQFWCVIFGHFVRHEMNRIRNLRRTQRAPRNTLNQVRPVPVETPDSHDADLSLVRHKLDLLTHNHLAISRLPLCLKKSEFSGLVRHPAVRLDSGLVLCLQSNRGSPDTRDVLPVTRRSSALRRKGYNLCTWPLDH